VSARFRKERPLKLPGNTGRGHDHGDPIQVSNSVDLENKASPTMSAAPSTFVRANPCTPKSAPFCLISEPKHGPNRRMCSTCSTACSQLGPRPRPVRRSSGSQLCPGLRLCGRRGLATDASSSKQLPMKQAVELSNLLSPELPSERKVQSRLRTGTAPLELRCAPVARVPGKDGLERPSGRAFLGGGHRCGGTVKFCDFFSKLCTLDHQFPPAGITTGVPVPFSPVLP
jgi:hypothetical protein